MSYYIYLIASLPMLSFGAKMPFSYQEFLNICEGKIEEASYELLKKIALEPIQPYTTIENSCLRKYHAFEYALHNELVRIRASRTQRDANKYLKEDGYTDPSIARVALHARRSPSILEAERILDQERWARIDGYSLGHYFDIDFLTLYGLKLRILQRWQRINSADPRAQLEEKIAKEV